MLVFCKLRTFLNVTYLHHTDVAEYLSKSVRFVNVYFIKLQHLLMFTIWTILRKSLIGDTTLDS